MPVSNTNGCFVYVAAYSSAGRARMDFGVLKRRRDEGDIEHFDVALVHKDDEGDVHVRKRERRTREGTVSGVGVGALLGVLIPFAAIPVTVSLNAVKGGLTAYFRKGMSREDLQVLGEALGSGEAALVVLSAHDLADVLATELRGADRGVQRRVEGESEELRAALGAVT